MPGTTSMGIRYPLVGETVSATAMQTYVTDVDAQFALLEAKRAAYAKRPVTAVANSGQNVTSGVDTSLSWTDELLDTAGTWNAGTPTVFTVGPGIWHLDVNTIAGGPLPGTMFQAHMWVDIPIGTIGAMNKVDIDPASTYSFWGVNLSALIYNPAASLQVTARFNWTGTAGPFGWIGNAFLYRVRQL